MKEHDKSIFIAACVYDAWVPEALHALHRAINYATKNGYSVDVVERRGDSCIPRARSALMSQFWREQKNSHLFSVDADVEIPQDAIVRLASHGKPIIGGAYPFKMHGAGVVARMPGRTEALRRERMQWLNEQQGIHQVWAVGTGCMMVTLETVNTLEEKALAYTEDGSNRDSRAFYLPYVHCWGDRDEYLSEDWAFCGEAQEVGIEVWIDMDCECGHWGRTVYR